MSLLSPEMSIGTGLAVGAVVYGVFQAHLPPVADVRTVETEAQSQDQAGGRARDAAGATKAAGWTAAAVVAGVSLLAKDGTIFIIGGAMTVAMMWAYNHAITLDPVYKSVRSVGGNVTSLVAAQMPGAQPQTTAPTAPTMMYSAVI